MRINISRSFIFLLFIVGNSYTQAQNQWAMATIEEGENMPTLSWYLCFPQEGLNGVEYQRIYDASCQIRNEYQAPDELSYGFRMADKHIYIYDFDNKVERLAFDFTLTAGDHFTTYNGVDWLVDSVGDTLVNLSYREEGEPSSKRLLKVKSADGQCTDEWLEDFGSLSNHFMILPLKEKQHTHVLWMEYEYGHNLVFKISDDPLYTHDNGYPKYAIGSTESDYADKPKCLKTTYANGTLKVEIRDDFPPNRMYYCFYRVGDELYRAFEWSISPGKDMDIVIRRQYEYSITRLPAPESGQYTIHYDKRPPYNETVIANTPDKNSWSSPTLYDLQGRQLKQKPSKGLYIQGGKIVIK